MQDVMEAGARVTIRDLVAKPALNGRQARVLSWVAAKERYAVKLVHGTEAVTMGFASDSFA